MGQPIRKDGALESQLSIHTRCLASPMTTFMYRRIHLSMVGITTYRMEDTADHNLKHAWSIRATQVPASYHTRFPDCVGLAPNTTATTLRTVKALDTGPSSRSTDRIGLGINSAYITTAIIHHTTVFSIDTSLFHHLSHIRIVTSLGFSVISRLEDDQLKLPALAAIDDQLHFSPSCPVSAYFSTLLASSVIAYPVPIIHHRF